MPSKLKPDDVMKLRPLARFHPGVKPGGGKLGDWPQGPTIELMPGAPSLSRLPAAVEVTQNDSPKIL